MKAKILGCFRNLDNPDFFRWIAKQQPIGNDCTLCLPHRKILKNLEDTIQ